MYHSLKGTTRKKEHNRDKERDPHNSQTGLGMTGERGTRKGGVCAYENAKTNHKFGRIRAMSVRKSPEACSKSVGLCPRSFRSGVRPRQMSSR